MVANIPKIRFVRCPRCRQLLPELPDVPLYKCGACNVLLQAKNRGESSRSRMVETNPERKNEVGQASDGNESSSSNQRLTVCSADACISDLDHTREQAKPTNGDDRNPNAVSSSHEFDHCDDGHSAATAGNDEESSGIVESLRHEEESNANEGSCSNTESLTAKSSSIQFKAGNRSTMDEQVKQSQPPEQHDCDLISPREKIEGNKLSNHHNNVSDETVSSKFDGAVGDLSKSPTRSSHAYDASISSYGDVFDDHVLSQHPNPSNRTSFKPQRHADPVSTKACPPTEDVIANNNTVTGSDVQHQITNFSSMSLSEYSSAECGSAITDNNGNWNQELPSRPIRYGFQALEQGSLRESDAFHSVRTWMETERDEPYRYPRSRDSGSGWRSPSSYRNGGPSNYRHEELPNSPISYASDKLNYLEKDRIEALKKVEELRYQLSRSYGLSGKGKEKLPIRSGSQESRCLSGSYSHHCLGPELLPQYNTSYLRNPHQSHAPRKTISHQYGPPQSFTGQSSQLHADHPFPHCYYEDWQFLAQPPPSVFHRTGRPQVCPGHACYSCNSSPSCGFTPHRHNHPPPHEPRLISQEIEKLQRKERRRPPKRHCLPVAGAAPFIICNGCLKLLQLPADFLPSRRRCCKLRCSSCSRVLMVPLRGANATNHTFPYIPPPGQKLHSDTGNGTSISMMNTASTSHVDGMLQGDLISYSDDYGLSISKSNSTEGEPVLLVPTIYVHRSGWNSKNQAVSSSLKPPTEGRNKRVISEQSDEPKDSTEASQSEESSMEVNNAMSSLHQLMGYSSVSSVLRGPKALRIQHEQWESHPAPENQILENTVGKGSPENKTRSPLRKDLEHETPQFSEDTNEKDGSWNKSRNARDSNHRGFVKKGLRELNHGLEIMKHKVHVNARVIPDQLIKKG